MRYEIQLKKNLTDLADALAASSGLRITTVWRIVADDGAMKKRLDGRSMNVRTYDLIVGRFMTVWPEGVEWPPHVPKMDEALPLKPEAEKILEEFKARIAARAEGGRVKIKGDWPDDIPRPALKSAAVEAV